MRREMKASSFRFGVNGSRAVTKHRKLRGFDVGRGYCPRNTNGRKIDAESSQTRWF